MTTASQVGDSSDPRPSSALERSTELPTASSFRFYYFTGLLLFLNINAAASYSILTSPLPILASEHKLSMFLVGLIIATHAMFHAIGALLVFALLRGFMFRFLLTTGALITGTIQILMSVFALATIKDPNFVVLAFVLRAIAGLTAGVTSASIFALLPLCHSASDYSRLHSLLGCSTIIGLSGGCTFGAGAGLGGLYIPEVVNGGLLVLLACLVCYETPGETVPRPRLIPPLCQILRRPQVWCSAVQVFICYHFIGLNLTILRPYMAIFLHQGLLETFLITLITVPATFAYKLHRLYLTKPFIYLAFLFQSFALFVMAPAPFLHLGRLDRWRLGIAQIFTALAFMLGAPACLSDLYVESVVSQHISDRISMCATVGVFFNIVYSLGLCAGSCTSGAVLLTEKVTKPFLYYAGFALVGYAGLYGLASFVRHLFGWRRRNFVVGPGGHLTRRWPEAIDVTGSDERTPLLE